MRGWIGGQYRVLLCVWVKLVWLERISVGWYLLVPEGRAAGVLEGRASGMLEGRVLEVRIG